MQREELTDGKENHFSSALKHPFQSIKRHFHHADDPHEEDGDQQATSSKVLDTATDVVKAPAQLVADGAKTTADVATSSRFNPLDNKAEKAVETFEGRSQRWRKVKDPITGDLVIQRDVTEEEYRQGLEQSSSQGKGFSVLPPSQSQLNAEEPGPTNLEQVPEHSGYNSIPRKGISALIYQLPATSPTEAVIETAHRKLVTRLTGALILGALFSFVKPQTSIIGWLGAAIYVAYTQHKVHRDLLDSLQDHELEREKLRGEKVESAKVPESAEWLNAFLRQLWPQINAEMFSGLCDTLEDVLQASVPSFIESVKVSELTQGTTSLRLLALRRLDDKRDQAGQGSAEKQTSRQSESRHATEAKEQLGLIDEKQKEIEKAERMNKRQDSDASPDVEDEDDGSDYINLEIAFAYRPPKGDETIGSNSRTQLERSSCAHLLLTFFMKTGITNLPVPVNVSVRGIVGTLRLRIQLISQPPFLGTTKISFIGLPRIQIDAAPMRLVSVMDIPIISGFIQNAIDAAMAAYTAPDFLELDLAELISGDDVKREVSAVGVILVHIERASEVERSDASGTSDPYVFISFARYGKPLYSTRVIVEELAPRWSETTAILLPPEVVKAGERVAIELRDSDRISSDDLLGKAEVELTDLLKNSNQMIRKTSNLTGTTPGSRREGTVTWSIGFFAKAAINKHLAAQKQHAEDQKMAQKSGKSSDPADTSAYSDKEKEYLLQKAEKEGKVPVELVPPAKGTPSGILSITIHQIAALSVGASAEKGVRSRKPYEEGVNVQETAGEDAHQNPSSYVEVILCDQLVYRTRTKMFARAPIIQATTERFVRNWRQASAILVVRESRINEQDPIIGITAIKLSDIFNETSQKTDWYPFSGGIGSGRIRLSFLFRAVDISPDKGIQGCDIGTIKLFGRARLQAANEEARHNLGGCYLRINTIVAKVSVSASTTSTNEVNDVTWPLERKERPLRLPFHRRHASALVLEWRAKNPVRRTNVWGIAILWLSDLPDNASDEAESRQTLRVPVWDARNKKVLQRLRQNYHSFRDDEGGNKLGSDLLGHVEFQLKVKPGIDLTHQQYSSRQPDTRLVLEAWKVSASIAGTEALHEHDLADETADDSSSSSESSEDDNEDSGKSKGLIGRALRDKQEKENWQQASGNDLGTLSKPKRMVEALRERTQDTAAKIKGEFNLEKDKLGGQVEQEV